MPWCAPIVLFFLGCVVSSQSIDPCQSLADSYRYLARNNQSELFPPSQVLACLRTVPINESLSASQIEWYQNFIQFQSTLSYLRNPPTEYDLPPVDILGGLQAIRSTIESGGYNSTFYVELDVKTLVDAACDGHFYVSPQLVAPTNFLGFRDVQLASVSSNGTDLPKVYFVDDLFDTEASDLISIDDVEVNEAISSLALGFQNLDALYNSMLFNPPAAFFQGSPYNLSRTLIENDNTTYEFRNGSKKSVRNYIRVSLPLGNITSGQELYDKFLDTNTEFKDSLETSQTESNTLGEASSDSSATPNDASESASIIFPSAGYPRPWFSTSDSILAGFFLPNSTDTCVLNILGFQNPLNTNYGVSTSANATAYGIEFQNGTKEFLSACKADGRTKLLIDVRSNAGGLIYFGYDLFRQLFPTRIPYSGTRFRAHPAADTIGEIVSSLGPLSIGEDDELWSFKASPFNYFNSLSSPSQNSFDSWGDLYGPQTVHNDTFTNLLAWKFSDIALDFSLAGIVPTGFANNTQLTPQPFDDEDITLITDAQCGFTCATFVNLLLSQTNASTIAFGGRPTTDPMAVIGGVQGSNIITFSQIASNAGAAIALLTNNDTSESAAQGLSITKEKALEILNPLNQYPPMKIAGGLAAQAVNFRDSIAQGDQSMTPLQFTSPVLADCKVFYLRGDIFNVTHTWQRVANGDYVCADGGTVGKRRNGTSTVEPYSTSTASKMSVSFGILVSVAASLLISQC